MSAEGEPAIATESVLRRSGELPTEEKVEVEGYDFNQGIDYERILQSYRCCGFQATHFDRAVNEINRMVTLPFCALNFFTTQSHEGCSNYIVKKFMVVSNRDTHTLLAILSLESNAMSQHFDSPDTKQNVVCNAAVKKIVKCNSILLLSKTFGSSMSLRKPKDINKVQIPQMRSLLNFSKIKQKKNGMFSPVIKQ